MSLDLDVALDLDTPLFGLDGERLAYRFTPPIVFDMGPINPLSRGNQRRLFGFYKPHGRFVAVWKLPDGTYTQEQPFPLFLPEFKQQGNFPSGQWDAVTYVHVYQSPEVVSLAEAAALSAAGYSGNLT